MTLRTEPTAVDSMFLASFSAIPPATGFGESERSSKNKDDAGSKSCRRHPRCVRCTRNFRKLMPRACERSRVVSSGTARLQSRASRELECRQGLVLDRTIEGDFCNALGRRELGLKDRVRHHTFRPHGVFSLAGCSNAATTSVAAILV